MKQEENKRYQFFISYTRDSAEDLATHLRESLEKREICAFLDIRDIPKKVKKTEWWKYRDEALRNSDTVILLITHGFEKSDEVKKETSLAFDEEKELMLFRHKALDPSIIINLKGKPTNLGNYNQISFDTKEELVRKVLSAIVEEKTKLSGTPSIGKIQSVKAEAMPTATQGTVLLPDNNKITELAIDNNLLNQIFKQARSQAIDKYHDAQLAHFSIQVYPYFSVKVSLFLDFYSKWADKECCFVFSDALQQVEYMPPDRPAKSDFYRRVFKVLPWDKSPQWLEFVKRAYAKIGPFAPAHGTCYSLHAYPCEEATGDWTLAFDDGFSGRSYEFDWNGGEIDNNNVKKRD